MKKRLLITLLQIGLGSADFHYTNKNAHTPKFVERDPIARIFVTHGTPLRAAYFATYVSGAIAGAELLEHFHHPNLALLLRAGQIEENGRGTLYSATHQHEK